MLPADLATDITPLATVHCAGDLSFAETHSSRFFPSNRMMASEGGAPQVAPGVTTFGSGSQTSVSAGLGPGEGAACDGDCAAAAAGDWATRAVDIANTAMSAAANNSAVRFMLRTYTGYLRIEISGVVEAAGVAMCSRLRLAPKAGANSWHPAGYCAIVNPDKEDRVCAQQLCRNGFQKRRRVPRPGLPVSFICFTF